MKHSHYFKDVSTLQAIDVYRVLTLFAVKDHCIGHAIKKLLCAGDRGAKSMDTDVQEAIDTLHRWQEMRIEDLKGLEPDPGSTPLTYHEMVKIIVSDAMATGQGALKVGPDSVTRVKPWEQPDNMDYCESGRYEACGDLMNDDQASCDHPSWHPFPSLKYEQCVVCGIRRKIAGV